MIVRDGVNMIRLVFRLVLAITSLGLVAFWCGLQSTHVAIGLVVLAIFLFAIVSLERIALSKRRFETSQSPGDHISLFSTEPNEYAFRSDAALPGIFYQSMPLGLPWLSRISAQYPLLLFAACMIPTVILKDITPSGAFAWAAACVAGLRGWSIIRPRYIRVIPGRIDVLTFWFFAHEAGSCMSIDIRGAEISFASGVLRVRSKNGNINEIGLAGVSDPDKFVQTVSLAALDPRSTPDVSVRDLL